MSYKNFEQTPALGRLNFQASYYPAQLKKYQCKNGDWVIEYFVYNPNKSKMVCVRKKLNNIRSKFNTYQEFRTYAMNIVNDINHKLSLGWSPFEYVSMSVGENLIKETYSNNKAFAIVPKMVSSTAFEQVSTQSIASTESVNVQNREEEFVPTLQQAKPIAVETTYQVIKRDKIKDVVDRFITTKEKELRPDSMRSYKSICKQFLSYLKLKKLEDMHIQEFKKVNALQYLDFLVNTKYLRNRTYNNYLKSTQAFFQWAVEQCYIEVNPFSLLKTKREQEKIRTLVDSNSRKRIVEHLEKNGDIGFLVVCNLIFMSLIRPQEIRRLKIKDVDLKNKCINLDSSITKTHYARTCALSDQLIELLMRLHIDRFPLDYYLVGKDFVPNSEIIPKTYYSRKWVKVRKALNLPNEMQLYSLKDTGITTMLENGVPAITVMKHADHHDLAMTQRYANHKDTNLVEKIRAVAPEF